MQGFHDGRNRYVGTGIPWELVERLVKQGASPGPWFFDGVKRASGAAIAYGGSKLETIASDMVQEAGARLLLHTAAVGPMLGGNAVQGILVESKAGGQAVRAPVVVDASGDDAVLPCSVSGYNISNTIGLACTYGHDLDFTRQACLQGIRLPRASALLGWLEGLPGGPRQSPGEDVPLGDPVPRAHGARVLPRSGALGRATLTDGFPVLSRSAPGDRGSDERGPLQGGGVGRGAIMVETGCPTVPILAARQDGMLADLEAHVQRHVRSI